MADTKTIAKSGRKPIPEHKKKKAVNVTLSPKTLERLRQDAQDGKALSANQMATKIIERYYRMLEKKEKKSLNT
jgi:hypothetical protein